MESWGGVITLEITIDLSMGISNPFTRRPCKPSIPDTNAALLLEKHGDEFLYDSLLGISDLDFFYSNK